MGAASESVGERLRRLRLACGLSQRELACPGVSYAYISRIEAGTRQPSMKALRQLARKLDVAPTYLETGREIDEGQERELRLADAELTLRLGDPVEAEARLHELAHAAAEAGDPAMAARAQLALALAADERGEHAAAVSLFEQAFAVERPSPLERLDVYATLGRAYGALGQTEREIELYRGCLEEAARVAPESTSAQTRYRILLSYALSDAGQLAAAEDVLRDALPDATADEDPYMQVRVYWSLARLSEMEGRSSTALRFARRAIALLETTEDYVHRARAHLLAAWIMNSAGDGVGARTQLERAGHLFGPTAAAEDAAMLQVERARSEALLGNGDNAVRLAQGAIETLGDQHDPLLGTAYWALAEGHALGGDTDAGSDAFDRAVDLLSRHRRWREAAAACRAWATLLRSAGRPKEAIDALERATELAAHLHAGELTSAAKQPRAGRQR
jgi:transcriptional regulator with XRE-family HTH domain